jgi:hypothetical protein
VPDETKQETASVVLACTVAVVAAFLALLGLGEELRQSYTTGDDPDDLNWPLIGALVVGVAGSVAGILLAGRRPVRFVHIAVLVVTVVLALGTVDLGPGSEGDHGPATGCQEHSGGDSTCPGG